MVAFYQFIPGSTGVSQLEELTGLVPGKGPGGGGGGGGGGGRVPLTQKINLKTELNSCV